ncbi:HAD family hydrolase, partial [Mycolicibacterium sp.]|uniref:HAD family hydrolase n=1 Tax=Mycolicibacterium sp. TaxID=2320850 RepID=UPI0037CB6A58
MRNTPHDIGLVISTVDDTLLTPDRTLTPRSIEAVQRLLDAGIAFTLTSSRPPRGLLPLIETLGLTAPLAALDGALIIGPDLDVIVEHRMDRSAAESAINVLGAGGF